MTRSHPRCAVLFSGGTDSCCAAFVMAERGYDLDLLTFFEDSTKHSPLPLGNAAKLKNFFPKSTVRSWSIDTSQDVRWLSYERYFSLLLRYHFLLLATPGFSSLSWHINAIRHCRREGITCVVDGMTQELQHLPGHMPSVRHWFVELYRRNGIEFFSPVYDWKVPRDRQLVEQYVVNRHDRFLLSEEPYTTGQYLYEKGFFDSPNIKGTQIDFEMQHDCYPFIVYNMTLFWLLSHFYSWGHLSSRLSKLFKEKTERCQDLLHSSFTDDSLNAAERP